MSSIPLRRSERLRALPIKLYDPPTAISLAQSPTLCARTKKRSHLNTKIRVNVKRSIPFTQSFHSTTSTFTPDLFPTPTITTFNVNDLSSEASSPPSLYRRDQAKSMLADLLGSTDILAIQETGLRFGNRHYLQGTFPNSLICYNNYPHKIGTAGTMIILSPSLSRKYRVKEFCLPGLEGYVQLIQFSNPHDPCSTPIWQFLNIYLYTGPESSKQAQQIARLLAELKMIQLAPITYMAGDFNFITCPADTTSSSCKSMLKANALNDWKDILVLLKVADVYASFHTRFQICYDTPMSHSSRLDRVYIPDSEAVLTIYQPSLELVKHKNNSGLYYNAFTKRPDYGPRYRAYGGSFLSDHIPVRFRFTTPSSEKSKYFKIPMWIADTPAFEERFVHHWSRCVKGTRSFGRDNLFTMIAVRAASETIKLRSSYETNTKLVSAALGLYRQTQTLNQNAEKIGNLLISHPILKTHVYQVEDGRFVDDSLRDFLDDLLLTYSRPPPSSLPFEDLGEHTQDMGELSGTSPVKYSSPNYAHQLKKLLPSSRASITHLRNTLDDEPTDSPAGKAEIIRLFYSKLWQRDSNEPSPASMRSKLQHYKGKVNQDLIGFPTLDSVTASILSTNDSSPGPNGIPFNVYRRLVKFYAPIALDLFNDLAAGCKAPKDFNHGLLFLLPKGDSGLVADTRPLSVTNTNNRIIARIAAKTLEPAMAALIGPTQIGFIRGRQCDDHIIALTNLYYKSLNKRQQTFLLFLDVKKAFDQIHHKWLIEVLRKQDMPPWILSLVHGLLHEVQVAPVCGSSERVWIPIQRGVKQGCPLSPLLFILALDPIIRELESIPGVRVFAYADDMASHYKNLTATKLIAQIIQSYETYTGLSINGNKSGLLSTLTPTLDDEKYLSELNLWGTTRPPSPSEASLNPDHHMLLNDWYRDNNRLKFVSEYTYLGILIGANVSLADIFRDTIDKAFSRIDRYQRTLNRLSLTRKIQVINIFVNSLFSYKFRFYSLPHDICSMMKEKIRLAITPFNGGAFSYSSLLFSPKLVGLSQVLKDLWAFNTGLLASRSKLIHLQQGRYMDLESFTLYSTSPTQDNRLIESHRDAAAIDAFAFSRTLTPSLNDSQLRPFKNTNSSFLTSVLTLGHHGDAHVSHLLTALARRLNIVPSSPLASKALNLLLDNLKLCGGNLPSPVASHQLFLHNNALLTSRRVKRFTSRPPELSDPLHRCFICDAPDSEDSLEHYYICQRVVLARTTFLRSLSLPTSILLPAGASAMAIDGQIRNTASRYLTHLCFSTDDDSSLKPMTRAIACFNWAAWQGRRWSITNGSPLDMEEFTSKIVRLANTMFTPRKRNKGKQVTCQVACVPHQSRKTKISRSSPSIPTYTVPPVNTLPYTSIQVHPLKSPSPPRSPPHGSNYPLSVPSPGFPLSGIDSLSHTRPSLSTPFPPGASNHPFLDYG